MNKVGGLRLPDFNTYYNGAIIKAVQNWHRDH